MSSKDPDMQFFLSGNAHVYYALIGITALSILILAGIIPLVLAPIALIFILVFAVGCFVDIWVNGYRH